MSNQLDHLTKLTRSRNGNALYLRLSTIDAMERLEAVPSTVAKLSLLECTMLSRGGSAYRVEETLTEILAMGEATPDADLLGESIEALRGLYDAEQASVPFAPTPRIQAALSQAWTVLVKSEGSE